MTRREKGENKESQLQEIAAEGKIYTWATSKNSQIK